MFDTVRRQGRLLKRWEVPRILYNGEQYVAFAPFIEALKEVADDFHEAELHEACMAVSWLTEHLAFSMITGGFKDEQE